jgi:hypothetical protein
MAHDSDKGPDDRYLFVISPSEASAIICYDPVFSQHLVICQGDKELCSEWIHRHFGDDLLDRGFKIDGDGHAYHYRGITRNTCLIWMKVPSAQDAPLVFSLLAHEAVHAAYAVMECRGIKPDFNNEEFVAYYVQWVMNCYLQCIGLPSEDNSMFQKTCGQLPD